MCEFLISVYKRFKNRCLFHSVIYFLGVKMFLLKSIRGDLPPYTSDEEEEDENVPLLPNNEKEKSTQVIVPPATVEMPTQTNAQCADTVENRTEIDAKPELDKSAQVNMRPAVVDKRMQTNADVDKNKMKKNHFEIAMKKLDEDRRRDRERCSSLLRGKEGYDECGMYPMKDKKHTIPTLLLRYTYFLDANSKKAMSIGFDSITFKPLIIVQDFNGSHIVMTIHDWMFVALNHELAKKFFQHDIDQPAFNCSKNITVQHLFGRRKERLIYLQNTDNSHRHCNLSLNAEEYTTLSRLSDFFSTLALYLRKGTNSIEEYYNNYVYYCVMKKQAHLTSKDFFIPIIDTENTYNYSRLFHEIPILCDERLRQDIENYHINILSSR